MSLIFSDIIEVNKMKDINYVTLEDGRKCLHFHAVKHEGKWLSRDQWMTETRGNSLPLHEPLKSEISNKIACGILKEVRVYTESMPTLNIRG